MAKRALIVEDDFLIASELEDILLSLSLEVVGMATTEDDAVSQARLHAPDLLLVDYRLAKGNGLAAVERVERTGHPAIIFLTGSIEEVRKVRPGALVISKPFSPDQLKTIIRQAVGLQT
jgi:DNA-binding response OmpR family regulator